jgi:hypothetical protein
MGEAWFLKGNPGLQHIIGKLFLIRTSQEGLRQVYDGMYKFLLVTNFGGI